MRLIECGGSFNTDGIFFGPGLGFERTKTIDTKMGKLTSDIFSYSMNIGPFYRESTVDKLTGLSIHKIGVAIGNQAGIGLIGEASVKLNLFTVNDYNK